MWSIQRWMFVIVAASSIATDRDGKMLMIDIHYIAGICIWGSYFTTKLS